MRGEGTTPEKTAAPAEPDGRQGSAAVLRLRTPVAIKPTGSAADAAAARECRPAVLLGSALALLKDRRRWTGGHLALDRLGRPVRPHDSRAVRWSLPGALLRAAAAHQVPESGAALRAATDCLLRSTDAGLSRWERAPERTHADVIAVLRQAILFAHDREHVHRAIADQPAKWPAWEGLDRFAEDLEQLVTA